MKKTFVPDEIATKTVVNLLQLMAVKNNTLVATDRMIREQFPRFVKKGKLR